MATERCDWCGTKLKRTGTDFYCPRCDVCPYKDEPEICFVDKEYCRLEGCPYEEYED